MFLKLYAVVSLLYLQNVVFGRKELDMELPEISIYWYNVSGVISGNQTFKCSIITNSEPTVMWMNEENLLTDLWIERHQAEVIFSLNSWREFICSEAVNSGRGETIQNLIYKPPGFSTFNQVAVSFQPTEVLHSTCSISQNTQETIELWEVQANLTLHNTVTGNDISIDQMQILASSEFEGKKYTCNMSDVILSNAYIKTDEKLSTATQLSSYYRGNCTTNTDCIGSDVFMECTSEGYCDCLPQYTYDSSESRCKYNYYLNITVAAIAFSCILGVMTIIWCVTMVIRSYRRRQERSTMQQNLHSYINADPNSQVGSTNGSGSRHHTPSIDNPPEYLEVERCETPPPSFESIYSMELKVVAVDQEISIGENPVGNTCIYATCVNESISDSQHNSEMKFET